MIHNAQLEQITQLLLKHKGGLDFNALFSKGTLFVEKMELSLILCELKTTEVVYKVDDLYYHSAVDRLSPIEVEACPECDDRYPNKLIGMLKRDGHTGAVAYLFYKRRKYAGLTNEDIFKVVQDISGDRLHSLISRLIRTGYIELLSGNAHRGVYRWSGKYCYPFRICRTTDGKLLKSHRKPAEAGVEKLAA